MVGQSLSGSSRGGARCDAWGHDAIDDRRYEDNTHQLDQPRCDVVDEVASLAGSRGGRGLGGDLDVAEGRVLTGGARQGVHVADEPAQLDGDPPELLGRVAILEDVEGASLLLWLGRLPSEAVTGRVAAASPASGKPQDVSRGWPPALPRRSAQSATASIARRECGGGLSEPHQEVGFIQPLDQKRYPRFTVKPSNLRSSGPGPVSTPPIVRFSTEASRSRYMPSTKKPPAAW